MSDINENDVSELDNLLGQLDKELGAEGQVLVEKIKSGNANSGISAKFIQDDASTDSKNVYQELQNMGVPEKIKMAMFGNQMVRSVLIKDSNAMVAGFVLENNRISDKEIIDFARNTNVSEQILRTIARNKSWIKLYSVKKSLISNPKCPIDISLSLIKFLQKSDLQIMARSKNIPQTISSQCRKEFQKRARA